MRKPYVLLAVVLYATAIESYTVAQNRLANPLQVHLNLSGAFLAGFGSSISDPEIETFEISNWILPGISVGLHVNEILYAGFSLTPSRHIRITENWGFTTVNDGSIQVDYSTGLVFSVDGRVSPFRNGLYAGVSLVHIPSTPYRMDFNRLGTTVAIGSGNYNTDLELDWVFKRVDAGAIALGYNAIFRNGLSANLGLEIPVISSPLYEDIEIVEQSKTVSISDLDRQVGIDALKMESFYYPIQFIISIGRNF